MHPAIEHFCHSMFYTATDPIAKQFPDEFGTEVPEHAVAVAITCVGSPFALIYSTDSSEDLSLSGRVSGQWIPHFKKFQFCKLSRHLRNYSGAYRPAEDKPIPQEEVG